MVELPTQILSGYNYSQIIRIKIFVTEGFPYGSGYSFTRHVAEM